MRANVRGVIVGLVSLMVVSSAVLGASAASADSIQVQSYQRASQTQECTSQPGETQWQASWGGDSSWHPSWEQWANHGAGGWTCTRSITWARDASSSCATGGPCVLGDIGPGGGLVFLISGGLRYEMAPNTWGADETTGIQWCSDQAHSVATGTVVGTGSANTTSMLTSSSPFVACTSSAPNAARAYTGGGFSDWFLPSIAELNAMCNYSRNPTAPAAPSVSCYGGSGAAQDGTFAGGAYGFSGYYWSSSQADSLAAWGLGLDFGDPNYGYKILALQVRPIRSF